MSVASRVRAEQVGAVLHLVVGDGTRRNALGEEDWAELARRVRAAGVDEGVGAVLISGAQDTFSAGSDMREWADAEPVDVERAFTTMEHDFHAVEECPLPVVAAVEGVAAGCQLALVADLTRHGRLGPHGDADSLGVGHRRLSRGGDVKSRDSLTVSHL